MSLANLHGLAGITRDNVAIKAGVAFGSVTYHWRDMKKLRNAMVERAIETENLAIVGQAIAASHPLVKGISQVLRQRAVRALA